MDDEPTHLNKTEARGAETASVVRYILGASLALIVVLFAAVLLIWR